MLFFFDIDDGENRTRDIDGQNLPDRAAARRAALGVLPDIARDEIPDSEPRVFSVKVRQADGHYIFHATLTLIAEWLDGPDDNAGAPPRTF